MDNSKASIDILPLVDIPKIVEEKSQIVDNRENVDDCFFICDLGDIVKKHQRWLKEFPRIHPHYAVKCNTDPLMLKMLLAFGTGFDCASKNEIRLLLSLGARPDQIIFAHPCKQISHVEYSRDNDVKLIVFDSEEELIKMKKFYPDAELVLRVETDDSTSDYPFSNKFGAPLNSCKHLVETARSMCLNIVGISFHVGSGCNDVNAFAVALKNARLLFDYAETVGYKFRLLNIGGGFPGNDDDTPKFEEIADVVNQQLDIFFPTKNYSHIRIIAEPGRYYASSAFTLATNVIAKKLVEEHLLRNENGMSQGDVTSTANTIGSKSGFMYYINDGLHGSFEYLQKGTFSPTLLKKSSTDSAMYLSSIWGPTCDGWDKVIDHTTLPEIEVGDWIIWHNMGDYSTSISTSFNGYITNKSYYVIGEKEYSLLRGMTENIIKGKLPFDGFKNKTKIQVTN